MSALLTTEALLAISDAPADQSASALICHHATEGREALVRVVATAIEKNALVCFRGEAEELAEIIVSRLVGVGADSVAFNDKHQPEEA